MRGSAIETSRSRNSYIRSPRSVTRAPIGIPSRILKPAIDLRARRTCARWPGDRRQLLDRAVERLRVGLRLADAHVERDLLDARDLHDRVEPSSSLSCARSSSLVALLEARHVASRWSRSPSACRSPGRSRRACRRGRGRARPSPPSRSCRRASAGCRTGQTTITFETGTGAAFSMTPPGSICGAAHPARVASSGAALVCRLTMFRFSTITRRSPGRASMTRPCLPRSLPVSIWTSVALLDLHLRGHLEHLRGEADDLHEVLLAQLARDRAEDARAARVALVVDDHGGVLVERDRACRRRGRTASSSARRPPARPRPS